MVGHALNRRMIFLPIPIFVIVQMSLMVNIAKMVSLNQITINSITLNKTFHIKTSKNELTK